ncbi:hypothetical protein M5585_19950 [Serratia ureilytica]
MFGLFLLVCYTYLEDIRQQSLPAQYECLPVDGIISAARHLDKDRGAER